MRKRIRTVVLASLLLSLLAGGARAAEGFGRVCITRIPTGERWDANDTGAREGSTFTIQIDKLQPVLVTTNASGVFTNLSLAAGHLVSIRMDGKALTSFRFSFKGRRDHLRLWYNPFYGSWSLSEVPPGEKCACPESKSSNHSMQRTGASRSAQSALVAQRRLPPVAHPDRWPSTRMTRKTQEGSREKAQEAQKTGAPVLRLLAASSFSWPCFTGANQSRQPTPGARLPWA